MNWAASWKLVAKLHHMLMVSHYEEDFPMDQVLELSWLVAGFVLFFGLVAFVYRPSAAKKYAEIAKTPHKRDQ